jgi:hypothetical protein
VAVTAQAQSGVLGATARIVLHGDACPVVESVRVANTLGTGAHVGEHAETSKIFEPQSIITQKKAFTEVSSVWCCRKRACPAIDG